MSARDPDARYHDPAQSVPFIIERWAKENIHTCTFGRITEYDAATKRCKVQPVLRTTFFSDREAVEKRPILNVPLRQPSTGRHLMHHEIRDGDVAVVLFTQRGIEQFKEQWGEISDPPPEAFFAERDAIAMPWGAEDIPPVRETGWLVQNEDGMTYISLDGEVIEVFSGETHVTVNRDHAQIERGDSTVTVSESMTVAEVGSSTLTIEDGSMTLAATNVTIDGDLTVTGSSTLQDDISVAGDIDVTGDVDGVDVAAHKHTLVRTGTMQSGPPA